METRHGGACDYQQVKPEMSPLLILGHVDDRDM